MGEQDQRNRKQRRGGQGRTHAADHTGCALRQPLPEHPARATQGDRSADKGKVQKGGRCAQQRQEPQRANDIIDEATSATHANRKQENPSHQGVGAQAGQRVEAGRSGSTPWTHEATVSSLHRHQCNHAKHPQTQQPDPKDLAASSRRFALVSCCRHFSCPVSAWYFRCYLDLHTPYPGRLCRQVFVPPCFPTGRRHRDNRIVLMHCKQQPTAFWRIADTFVTMPCGGAEWAN